MAGKSERTRAAIREAAIASFRERGYDATTIRLLADELEMSVGSAYYYFPSKSHLVQELYIDVQEAHERTATPRLAGSTKLIERLRIVFETGLDQLEPYGAHAHEFLNAAMAPDADTNPLSPGTATARDILTGLFRTAVEGSDDRIPSDIKELLPEALYRINLLLALTWVQDRSDGHARTRRLLDQGLRLCGLALPTLRLPPVRKLACALLGDVGALGT